MGSSEYRQYLFPHDHPRLAGIRGLDAYGYREAARKDEFTGGLINGWEPLYLAPFRGVSENGEVRPGLHPLETARPGERAPVEEMREMALRLVDVVSDADRERLSFPVDAPEWQTWANPEFMQFDTGLRLDFQPPAVQRAALALVEASLSPEGYALVREMMRINGYLGEVVDLPKILNEFSYNIALYGIPDSEQPWGWQLYGHHAAVNCLVVDGNMIVSPMFLGAEPDQIDEGEYAGSGRPFQRRVDLALELMNLLPDDQRAAAVLFQQMVDPAMPEGRVHPGDERHLAGAFQDNRVIPFEGTPVARMPERARELVLDIVEEFFSVLPEGPRAARMRQVRNHLQDMWWCWIGGHQPGDVFYFRVQSPVVVAELDHHCGVFLDYDTPRPFHIHTVLRTPHGNDYGRAWVTQWPSGNLEE
ncbi:DUF3500 domain-containing protein [Streptomyces sp. NPDC091217]|uniref:DUF3500 domain-containing protein n=1 Tax=Streptomyces sp. NPDC091217 TaxID=3365975 RepID=UPI00381402FD